ncbi:MAG TPA: toxin-antitoxin system HicB family antitoxin [Limnochordia bacterium]|nr:toxin-antitoxin system HicB family antitoxin [Limnochordia bacterium]
MARLTVRLPETLHEHLTTLAEREGVSLNHYIVYLLTRQASTVYVASPSQVTAAEQRREYQALAKNIGKASNTEFEEILAEREETEPEPGLTPEIVERVRARMAKTPGRGRRE